MAGIPESTKISLRQRLVEHATGRWPRITALSTRYRGPFVYVTATDPDGDAQPLCRLRYVGYANNWGFAIWRASHNDYADSILADGSPTGTAEAALDLAAGLYLPATADNRRTNGDAHYLGLREIRLPATIWDQILAAIRSRAVTASTGDSAGSDLQGLRRARGPGHRPRHGPRPPGKVDLVLPVVRRHGRTICTAGQRGCRVRSRLSRRARAVNGFWRWATPGGKPATDFSAPAA
ncbi:hypothetical protein ThrDRAFT_04208 [Frankia casuarinae]|nr:hypothetical protein CcI6DRAFT_04497 [Frankia sp. CcI6]EYT90177.1 hypothetical protein ThrDRAFT_04208 [Frankia casuarinae]KEZ34537.1 hypothetical protein CEDDRAFT_04119 [Frankia sp. CeD]KFB02822.1 hypothetical protein ALLO2DRAFT_04420 [Frankia sp. Allo2]